MFCNSKKIYVRAERNFHGLYNITWVLEAESVFRMAAPEQAFRKMEKVHDEVKWRLYLFEQTADHQFFEGFVP